jgi:hypothetical protein
MTDERPQQYIPASADSLARLHTAEAIGALVTVMRRKGAKEADVIKAASELLDRGHGKAVQATIAVPVRQAVAAKLAGLDDSALLAIAAAGRAGRIGDAPLSLPFGLQRDAVTDAELVQADPPREPDGDAEPAVPHEFESQPNLPGNPWD